METKEELKEFCNEINFLINSIIVDLCNATEITAAARRVRTKSVTLGKMFKEFRKQSCALGLK